MVNYHVPNFIRSISDTFNEQQILRKWAFFSYLRCHVNIHRKKAYIKLRFVNIRPWRLWLIWFFVRVFSLFFFKELEWVKQFTNCSDYTRWHCTFRNFSLSLVSYNPHCVSLHKNCKLGKLTSGLLSWRILNYSLSPRYYESVKNCYAIQCLFLDLLTSCSA